MPFYTALLDFFYLHPWVFIFYCAILGLVIGSFLNVVIYRLPLMMQQRWRQDCAMLLEQSAWLDTDSKSADTTYTPETQNTFNLLYPHSHCPNCQTRIKIWQNIPILSYLLLAGRCGSCQQKISLRYPLVELVSALLSICVAWKFSFSWPCLAALLVSWALLSLSLIDLDHQLLPDDITLPLIWFGLIINAFGCFTTLENALWGAIAGYLILWSIYWLFKLLTGKEGMGYGDFKLFAALGACLGWQMLAPMLLIASLSGSVVGIVLLFKSSKGSQPFAFGPYLAMSGWICLMLDKQLLQFYSW